MTNVRGICRRLAAEGYAPLGVDLFEGRSRAVCMARMFLGGMTGNLDYYGVPALGRLALAIPRWMRPGSAPSAFA